MTLESDFKGKTTVVAGAVSPLGVKLCTRLALAGCTVVALDNDQAGLLALAKRAPNHIEPLHLNLYQEGACRQIGRIWGREPVHFLANLHPLGRRDAPVDQLQSIAVLSRVMLPALRAAKGSVASVFTQKGGHDLLGNSLSGAMGQLIQTLSVRFSRHHVRVNGVMTPTGAAGAHGHLIDPLLFLGSSYGRGVNGQIIPVLPQF